ncbi:MAG: hypothetical protein BMS9Abin07_1065 [Acidimicrobiia bacterium]|nr:MAG: hypothetical protein BMS9Abin07_1065 [Acidimicrobiia bacterium]
MFVKYYTHLERSFADLASFFTTRDLPLNELATDAYRDGERLTARIGVGGTEAFAKTVELQLQDLSSAPDKVVLSIGWTATGPTALFPRMDGDLMIEPLGPDLTQLSFQGSYTPPFGAPGLLLDQWVLHRVAEASVKNLVDRVADSLRTHNGVLSE